MIILRFLGFGFGLSTSAGVRLTLKVNEHPSIFPMDAPENIPGINGLNEDFQQDFWQKIC